jgi:hypothetical protein
MQPMTFDDGSHIQPAPHIADRDLALYVFDKLDPERSSSLRAHVRVCAACKDGFLTRLAAHNNGRERRVEGRLQSGEHGYVQTLSPFSFERPTVQMIDVSGSGLGLLMNSSLAAGTIVQVCVGTTTALGEVRSCQAIDNNQFRLGIRAQTERS